jgi:prevent-host-death family protein
LDFNAISSKLLATVRQEVPLTGLSTGAINGLHGGVNMSVKFSEDIVPLSEMKINPGKIVKRTNESHRPVLLTSRGRGVAVMQSLDDFESAEEEKAFMRGVVEGFNDLDNKRELSLEAAKARLGLK